MNLELKSAGKRKQIALGKVFFSWEWWCTLVIPALRRLRQEDWNLEANLGYTSRRTCLKKREREREKRKISFSIIVKCLNGLIPQQTRQ
jgi:hypothetical protein